MNDFVITLKDLKDFSQGVRGNRVQVLWNDFIKKLPSHLKKEAETKDLELVVNPVIKEDPLARYLLLNLPGSSSELKDLIEKKVPSLICIKDYELY